MSHASRSWPGTTGHTIKTLAERLQRSRNGSTAMIFALLAVPVVGIVGFSVDMTRSSNAKADLRAALDASLLSAAHEKKDGFQQVAETYFTSNAADMSSHSPKAQFRVEETEKGLVYHGTATAEVSSTFSSLLGVGSFPLRMKASVTIPKKTGDNCIWVMDESANHALTFNAQATVSAPGCSIQVQSRNKHAASFSSNIDIDFASICVAGEGVTNNYGPIEGLETSCQTEPDPFAATMPAISPGSCDYTSKNYNGGNVTLHPGTYCGHMNFNNGTNVTFEPGLYVLNGAKWNVNGGQWDGEGISFYFHTRKSGIQFNSAVTSGLTPPANGPYEGLMMFEAPGLKKSNFIFNDSKDFQIEGLVYLPSRDAIYNSNSIWRAREMTMVFNTLKLNQTNWELTPGVTMEGPDYEDVGELRVSS
ncbi:TadE/TadG family type IV pilus assembly protein [Henriciella sp.]|uniref:TadE/TadG family type IV pilus assembly protein n=1 Tax=Henriciella sp. TaxID=1968823 RepID=UPI0026190469|nr:TadE/TadG family type IV pilus assembly protein [Henriciella sp.]